MRSINEIIVHCSATREGQDIPVETIKKNISNLINQIKPFDIKFHLSERVDEVKKEGENWIVKTNKETTFSTPNVIIAGGRGITTIHGEPNPWYDPDATINTDAQALQISNCKKKIQLGIKSTRGLGAGMRPDVGRNYAD